MFCFSNAMADFRRLEVKEHKLADNGTQRVVNFADDTCACGMNTILSYQAHRVYASPNNKSGPNIITK